MPVAATEIIRVGVFDNQPLVFKNQQGKASGFMVELLEQIALKHGWQLEYQFAPWGDQLIALEQNQIDLLIGMAYSEERARKFDFTAQAAINNWAVVLQASHLNLTSLEELSNKRIALMRKSIHSTAFIDTMEKFGFDFDRVEVVDYEATFTAVLNGEADAAVVNRVFSMLHKDNHGLKDTGIILNPIEVRYAAPKGQRTEILLKIDEALARAKSDANSFYYVTLNKWLGSPRQQLNYAWLLWLVVVIVTLLVLVVFYNLLLARQVKKRTRELANSEQRYRMAQQAARIGSWEWDIKTNKIYWSDNIAAMFGMQVHEFSGTYDAYLALLDPADREFITETVQDAVNNKRDFVVEHKILWPDGSTHWLSSRGEAQYDKDGKPFSMAGVVQDITERIEAESALNKSRAEFQAIFDSISDAIIFADTDRRIIMVNPAVNKIFGYAPDEIINQSTALLYADKQAYQLQGKQRYSADVKVEQTIFEVQYRRKNGEVFPGETMGTQVKDHLGQVIGFVGMIRDISERKKFLKELQESEARYEALSHIVPVGIFRTDRNGHCVYVNERWCELAGLTEQEALGEGWQRALHPDDQQRVFDEWYTAAIQNKVFQSEYRFKRPDGVTTWLLGQAHDERDADNNLIGYVGTVTDINELKNAQATQRRLAQIFDASINEIYLFDADTLKFTLVNRAALDNLGYTLGEIQQLNPVDIKPEYDEARFRQILKPLQSNKKSLVVFETMHQRKDGSTYPVEVRLQKLPSESGASFMAIILDITDRKIAEKELKKMNVELEYRVRERTARLHELNKELESFSYSVSHDLRAPLRAIDGFSEALREDYGHLLDATGKEYLHRVRNAAQRMSLLIDDLLHLSRVTRAELEKHQVNLSRLVEEVIVRYLENDKLVKFEYTIEPGLLVQADKRLLEIVITNLIDNAIKYSKNVPKPKIEFGSIVKDGKRVYFVRDNGSGFDMRFVSKLFTPFQRLHTPSEYEGAGVGLATVKRIITRHGGEVWAESAINQGAVFYFTL